MKKLKNAEHEYATIIEDAHKKANETISFAVEKQKHIAKEHELLLIKHRKESLDSANRKSEEIVKNAELEAKKMKQTLEDSREESVKYTSKIVVKKMITDDTQLKDSYISALIKEIKK